MTTQRGLLFSVTEADGIACVQCGHPYVEHGGWDCYGADCFITEPCCECGAYIPADPSKFRRS